MAIIKNKYNISDRIKGKIWYGNGTRKEVEAIILGVEFVDKIDAIRYKVRFEPEEKDKKLGCTGCQGYILESNIIGLC